jgi:hypothetical protein
MQKYFPKMLLALSYCIVLILFTSITLPTSRSNASVIKLEKISVKHLDWDQIVVSFDVIDEKGDELVPEQTMVKVFSAKGKLIAQSFGKRVLLNDAELGSEETLKIEVEVVAMGNKLMHSEVLRASKKQMNFNPMIVYPLKKQLYAGAYSILPKLYRVKFGSSTEYENVEFNSENVQYFLTVKDEGTGKKIAVSVKRGSSKFKLSDSPQYDDFKPYLESSIADNRGATLKFSFLGIWNDKNFEGEATDVHLAFSGVEIRKHERPEVQIKNVTTTIAQVENAIVLGSLSEIQKYARVAASRLSESYRVIPESLHVNVHQWKFDAASNLYEANISMQWANTFATEEKYVVKGTLIVDKQGKRPDFQRSYANQTILDIEKYNKLERAMASVK